MLERRKSNSEFQDLIQKKVIKIASVLLTKWYLASLIQIITFQSEIRDRILSKINLLREERESIVEEKRSNDKQGQLVLENLEGQASSNEIDRVYKYLQEVEQITKLSVSLAVRLNRVTSQLERRRSSESIKERVGQ